MAHSLIFREVAMVFAGALIFGMLAWRLRQPLILGYVFAGLFLSPFTPGLHVQDVHTFEVMAEVGVILTHVFCGNRIFRSGTSSREVGRAHRRPAGHCCFRRAWR